MNAEHSWADALVVAHMWERVLCCKVTLDRHNYTTDGHCKPISKNTPVATANPVRLKWDMTEPDLIEGINSTLKEAQTSIADLDLRVMEFNQFGNKIIKTFGISPDSCAQMAMQLAFFRDQKKFGLTYEASMVRLFRHGRTETIRSLSNETVAFVQAMEGKNKNKFPPEEIVEKLRVAADGHRHYSKDAMAGHGVDRHLFGLYVVASGKGVESDFLKNALSEPWLLSTSQQPQIQHPKLWNPVKDMEDNKCMSAGGGFGPVADDGYGVSYMFAGGDHIFFHVSSKISAANTNSHRFAEAISQALQDIQDVIGQVKKNDTAGKASGSSKSK